MHGHRREVSSVKNKYIWDLSVRAGMDKMRKNEEGRDPIHIGLGEFNLGCFNFLWLVSVFESQ